jgi:DNA-binding NarL/FixJ family response regulator
VTRVFIAAPTPMMRAGLRAMLESPDLQVAGESASVVTAGPDLLGVDVLLVGSPELLDDRVRSVVGEGVLSMLVLSEDDRPASFLRSLPLRGWGILPPDTPAPELQAAVLAVHQGLITLSLPLANRLLAPRAAVQALDGPALEESLTTRELEVLGLLSQGLSNKLIASRLQISEHTVKFHVSSIYTKLGAASRTEAVSRGARLGLISF